MSVTIHGIECRNCYDVDWARRVEAEDKKKDEAEAAKKAKEATTPPGAKPDIVSGVDQTSGLDSQPAILFDGALKQAASAAAPGATASNTAARAGASVNVLV